MRRATRWDGTGGAIALLLWLGAGTAAAHVGSPDIFLDEQAGPYRLFITIRPPAVIPGVAELSVRSATDGLEELEAVALPLRPEAHPPQPELAVRARRDPRHFSASLWLMTAGSWQVRLSARGERGEHVLSVPVPAIPTRVAAMSPGLAVLLAGLGLFLALGAVAVVGSAAREADLPPGAEPDSRRRRRARWAMFAAALILIAAIAGGRAWWLFEERGVLARLYRPLSLHARVEQATLDLSLEDPGWLSAPRLDRLVPDHGYLMHLFAVRVPALDRVFHLHPEAIGTGRFRHRLPDMPAGRYQLFADVVHDSGLPETAVAFLEIPEVQGGPPRGDDAAASVPAVDSAAPGRREVPLDDGGRVVWDAPVGPLVARAPQRLRFRVLGPDGALAKDLEPYLGMAGHAAIVDWSGRVFAHVHPTGSVPMAAMAIARSINGAPAHGPGCAPEAEVSALEFPYGFPAPGRYRVFLQFRRSGRVQTAAFDFTVVSEEAG